MSSHKLQSKLHYSLYANSFFFLFYYRYFFEKSQNCDVHAKNLAKSLNELYTEPAPKTSPFDLPQEFPLTRSVSTTTDIFSNSSNNNSKIIRSSRQASAEQLNNTDDPHRSMSTKHISRDNLNLNSLCGIATKGILSNGGGGGSSSNNNNNNVSSGGGGGGGVGMMGNKRTKSKDELFHEFCERAGHRPKPKDIYFIESDTNEDDNKSIFIIDKYTNLRKNSRRSSCVLSNNQNSNLCNSSSSLNKSYPKSLFDLDNCDRTFLNNCLGDNNNYFQQNNSRDRSVYSSRTLPRDFLKRNVEFLDVDHFHAPVARRISASGVYSAGPADYYKKSYETLPNSNRNFRQRDAYTGDDTVSVHWPNAIPASPSSFSARSQFRIHSSNLYPSTVGQQVQSMPLQQPSPHLQHTDQHTFYGKPPPQVVQQLQPPPSQQQQQSASPSESEDFDMFDLDKIEHERRKSHASLFDGGIDFENGTAV